MTQVLAVRIPTTAIAALDRAALQLGLRRSDLARGRLMRSSRTVRKKQHASSTKEQPDD
jgi:hypothetical protein